MTGFMDRYEAAFGRGPALLLRLSGLVHGEVSARGPWVTDAAGESWLDFGSFGLHLIGHLHPAVVEAARDQLGLMGLSTKVMGNGAATACAEALVGSVDGALDHVVFANSGAEAVEIGLKMAMLTTGRRRFLAFRNGYHGKTVAALSLSDGWDSRKLGLGDRVNILNPSDWASISELLATETVAAAIVEPIRGEGGILPLAPGDLAHLREATARAGTMLIMDEIQTGLGRCGRIWRSAGVDVVPDVLLAGKGLGGGVVPISAALFRTAAVPERVADPVVLASSFAGGALAGRIGATVVGLVQEPAFLARVGQLGERTRAALRAELGDQDGVIDIRGEGLMIGVELATPGMAGQAVLEAARRRLLITFCLHQPTVLRVYPPAVCTDEEVDLGVERLVEAVQAACALMQAEELTRR